MLAVISIAFTVSVFFLFSGIDMACFEFQQVLCMCRLLKTMGKHSVLPIFYKLTCKCVPL
jgi:hypothetical protein